MPKVLVTSLGAASISLETQSDREVELNVKELILNVVSDRIWTV